MATHAVFVAAGCLRTYTIDAQGREHIVQFLPEQWWWSDAASIMSGAPSQYFAEAVEDTELLTIDLPSHQRLLQELPAFAASHSAGVQRHNAAKDQRIVSALSATAEERYTAFVADLPLHRAAGAAVDARLVPGYSRPRPSAGSARSSRAAFGPR